MQIDRDAPTITPCQCLATQFIAALPTNSETQLIPEGLVRFCDGNTILWLSEHFQESGYQEHEIIAFCVWRQWLTQATEGKEITPEIANALRLEARRQWASALRVGNDVERKIHAEELE